MLREVYGRIVVQISLKYADPNRIWTFINMVCFLLVVY